MRHLLCVWRKKTLVHPPTHSPPHWSLESDCDPFQRPQCGWKKLFSFLAYIVCVHAPGEAWPKHDQDPSMMQSPHFAFFPTPTHAHLNRWLGVFRILTHLLMWHLFFLFRRKPKGFEGRLADTQSTMPVTRTNVHVSFLGLAVHGCQNGSFSFLTVGFRLSNSCMHISLNHSNLIISSHKTLRLNVGRNCSSPECGSFKQTFKLKLARESHYSPTHKGTTRL